VFFKDISIIDFITIATRRRLKAFLVIGNFMVIFALLDWEFELLLT